MKTYCKLVDFHCDINKDHQCELQLQSVLQWWETKTDAYKEARRAGWLITKDRDVCSYCRQFIDEKKKSG